MTNTVHEVRSTPELELEVRNARIWAGIHFNHSVIQGGDLGRKVAQQAFRDFFARSAGEVVAGFLAGHGAEFVTLYFS